MLQIYIAFSIHGTETFITANKNVRNEATINAMASKGFKVVQSRRPNYDAAKHGYKLSWDRLNTVNGEPLRSVPMILARFKELEANGWKIDKTNFIKKHYVRNDKHKGGTSLAVSRGQQEDRRVQA